MQAIGNDGRWHDWADLSPEEQQSWHEAMNIADRIHDYYKVNPRPLTLRESMLEYERKRTVIHY